MSPRQALASALHIFAALSFFAVGVFFVALPYLPSVRIQVVDFFLVRFEQCSLIGVALLIVALVLLAGFYALDRGRYLVIKMGTAVYTNNPEGREFDKECALNLSQAQPAAKQPNLNKLGDGDGLQIQRLPTQSETDLRGCLCIDLGIVRQAVEECFNRQFQKKLSLSEVEVGRKSRLEIEISMEPLEESAREELFVRAEKELGALLKERFGYAKPFYLIVRV